MGAHRLGTESAPSLVYAEHRLLLEAEGLSGWSGAPGLTPPPGAKEVVWPGYMAGTLWADKVLPGGTAREAKRQEGRGRG